MADTRATQAELEAQRRLNFELQEQCKTTQRLHADEIAALTAALNSAQASLDAVRNSFWLRLGKKLDIGPWTESGLHLKRLNRSLQSLLHTCRAALVRQSALLSKWTQAFLQQAGAILTPVYLFLLHYLKIPCAFVLLTFTAFLLALEDLCFACFGKRALPKESWPEHAAASVVIANWNGRHLLQSFLPSVIAAMSGHAGNEIIVVDNASTDGSAAFLRAKFPEVRVLEMEANLGFGGASNAGVKAAKNEVVVLLNNDMKVAPDFLAPLLRPFEDPLVFAVSSQIYFYDKTRLREETGLTEVRWENGVPKPGHRIDPVIETAFPCAYPGGGSSAFHRGKLLELGGFDPLFEPFYYEDTDLGFLAWKRGWKVLYQPASIVNHCHRATIGKTFPADFIQGVLNRNVMLYCWKNIHDWRMLAHHLGVSFLNCLPRIHRAPDQQSLETVWSAFQQITRALKSRWLASSKAALSDREAFQQPLGGYFRDRFIAPFTAPPPRLQVLFAAPFPIEPPIHGGGVFMKQTVTQLARRADVHLVSFLDNKHQLADQQPLHQICKSAHFIVRPIISRVAFTLTPFPVLQFSNRDFLWVLHRTLLLEQIDIVQLEYTMLAQYAGKYKHIPCLLFEHDIASQSLRRGLKRAQVTSELLLEYLRMRRYEPRILKQVTRVQVCSAANADYLKTLAPQLRKVDLDMRAAIDTSQYGASTQPRDMRTLLFVGGFSHPPNLEGVRWFITQVFPRILKDLPDVRLDIVGANPPAGPNVWDNHPNIRLVGPVSDIRLAFRKAGVFICPILTGSGIRVKLLEAFASQIAVVSTSVGAEGLASTSGDICELADTPEAFAQSVVLLFNDATYRSELVMRARLMVEKNHDSQKAVARLESAYRNEVLQVRPSSTRSKQILIRAQAQEIDTPQSR